MVILIKNGAPVASFFIRISAPAALRPEESETTPESEEVTPPCPIDIEPIINMRRIEVGTHLIK